MQLNDHPLEPRTAEPQANNSVYQLGWIFIVLGAICYAFGTKESSRFDLFSGPFALAYVVFLGYFVITLSTTGIRFHKLAVSDHRLWINNVIILTFSALCLNVDMQVFAPFPIWMNITICFMMAALLIFPYRSRLPSWGKSLLGFVQGTSWLMSLYLIFFVGPLQIIALPALLFLGISIHALVPMFWLITLTKHIRRNWSEMPPKKSVVMGFFMPILALSLYLFRWNTIQNTIKETQTGYYLHESHKDLPQWVVSSQTLPNDILTETILTSPVTAQRPDWGIGANFGGKFRRYHNPFAIIAMTCLGEVTLDNQTVKHLLESKYDARHDTHRRLWSGNDLHTKTISTNVEVHAAHRLAYLEKTMTIHYQRNQDNWDGWSWSGDQQEAVYTFHLPEGSVMTSLSLWVNGLEEKSRLTTRSKADSAYTQIVRRERRDPALMHWQEGNRVTVTVFPCTSSEDRVFKIGCTIPLAEKNNLLSLKSIWMEGPDLSEAYEKIAIRFAGGVKPNLVPSPTKKILLANDNSYSGAYLPDWSLDFEAPPVSTQTFDFQGNSYKMEKWNQATEPFQPQEIVLDVTNEWSSYEIEKAFELFKGQKMVAFLPEKTQVTAPSEVQKLRKLYFNMLPLYRLNPSGKTLVVTKTGQKTPFISDLEVNIPVSSPLNREDGQPVANANNLVPFSAKTKQFFKENVPQIRVFDLSEDKSAYWQSFRAIRLVQYASGTIDNLKQFVNNRTFPILDENENRMIIPESGVSITRTISDSNHVKGNAPDHLMRLYAYNDLMRLMGKDFFDKKNVETKFVRKAEEAFIVSPLSSLVVLESKADYDRMGIKENRNSLGNAGIGNKGAVPEPHEWALLAVIAMIVAWQYRKRLLL
jgi:XrtN system VIT domain protein